MKLDRAIAHVQDAESDLGKQLRVVGERHAVEQDLYHLGHTLARQCATHIEKLAPFAQRYGGAGAEYSRSSRRAEAAAETPPILETMRHKSAELLGRTPKTGLLLLRDLENLYLTAQATEIAWISLTQTAQAIRDSELLRTANLCHEETEAQAKWLRTRIKEAAPQILGT